MSEADKNLVRRAQDGDRTAFEELVRRTSRLAFARLCLETGDAHRADRDAERIGANFRNKGELIDPSRRADVLIISERRQSDAPDARRRSSFRGSHTGIGSTRFDECRRS